MASLLDTFRVLSSFQPRHGSLTDAPWEPYVDWAVANGLGPLAAYNLEYRLGGAGAPDWAMDRLLSIYQGSLNDNVMKLVNFKRAIDELEGRRMVLLGAAAFAEALYPHVAFRPVLEMEALVPAGDLDPLTAHLAQSEFKTVPPEQTEGADRVLYDGRTRILLYAGLLGTARRGEEEQLLARAQPMKVYGPSVFRLSPEDAVLVEALGHAQSGYQLPAIGWVDFRELIAGAPDPSAVLSRARAWKIERALWASLATVSGLFPEVAQAARRLQPSLRLATQKLLERAVVKPTCSLDPQAVTRTSQRLRRLLIG